MTNFFPIKSLFSILKKNGNSIAIEQSEQHQILEGIINDLEAVDVLIKVKPNNYDILAGRVKMQSILLLTVIQQPIIHYPAKFYRK